MPDLIQLALYVAAALLLAVTPGAGIFYVAARTLAGGRAGAAARPGLIRRLREGSGGAMVALGIGLALARRPAG